MRTIVFPVKSNRTFRAGFIKLTAFASDFNQATIDSTTANIVESLRYTGRELAPDYTADDPMGYLRNAISNMQTARHKMIGDPVFSAILPLPLTVEDDISVNWQTVDSNFIDGAYGRIKDVGIGLLNTTGVVDSAAKAIDSALNTTKASGFVDSMMRHVGAAGVTTGTNGILGLGINGHESVSASIADHPEVKALARPSEALKSMIGFSGDGKMHDYFREAQALSGARQVIFDPGYWQSFQGVEPRSFFMKWQIIPENHEDAIRGLEMCSRIREYSLPQQLSGVELAAPHFWHIDWSNDYLTAQTLYSNVVIKQIQVKYAEEGEWHVTGTPKMFDITIHFQEARAPTSDIYKVGSTAIPVAVGASGAGGSGAFGSGSTSGGSGSLGSVVNILTNSGSGQSWGSTGLGNVLGGMGSVGNQIGQAFGGSIDGILQSAGQQASGLLGQVIGSVTDTIAGTGANLGDIVGSTVGGIGSVIDPAFGQRVGNILDEAITNASSNIANTVFDAIQTGDFSGIADRIKQDILTSAEQAGAGAVAELEQQAQEIVGGVINDQIEIIRQNMEKWSTEITEEIRKALEEANNG